MKRGRKYAILISVATIIIVAVAAVFLNNSTQQDNADTSTQTADKINEDGNDDVYQPPTKPVSEWTNEELARDTAYWKKRQAEHEKKHAEFEKLHAERIKFMTDFEQNREKRREAFRNLSVEEMKAHIEREFNNMDPESQRLIREYDESFDLEAVIASSPELQDMIKKQEEDRQKLELRYQDLRKVHERIRNRVTSLLYEAEKKGAILIYNEGGRPIGYEKDEYGDPILIPIDEDIPESQVHPTSQHIAPLLKESETLPTQSVTLSPPLENSSLADQVTDLWIRTSETYPETVFVPMLSKEEFNLYFPNEDEKKWLEGRKKRMQNEVVSAVMKILSSKFSQKEIDIVKENIARFWDKEFAETIIQQVKRDVE